MPVAQVLKPGAPFVLFDILSAGVEEPQYPAPWAATPEQSFLATADEMSAHLERAGFSIIEITDQTSKALAFLDEIIARIKSLGAPPPLGLHLVVLRDNPASPVIRKRVHQKRCGLERVREFAS